MIIKKVKIIFLFYVLISVLPIKCRESEDIKTSSPLSYSVNFMWINRSLNENQKYIHPAKNKKSLKEDCLKNIFQWALDNPEAEVNFWFDSALIPEQGIKNTEKIINKFIQKNPNAASIKLKDIRDFPKVKKHPEVFSDKTPVYFRADLLRVIATLHTLNHDKDSYFVYADLDIPSLTSQQLFDKKTVKKLSQQGIVVARDGFAGFENGFHMACAHKENLLKAMKSMLIKLNIKRAKNALRGNFSCYKSKDPRRCLGDIVYKSYSDMFELYNHLEEWGTLKDCKTKVTYNRKHEGLKPFGLNSSPNSSLCFKMKKKEMRKNALAHRPVFIPTKKVEYPPITSCYDEI